MIAPLERAGVTDCDVTVAVIGAGVVGAAIARELVRLGVSVALVEAASDVGAGTSKANTAILHTGFDAKPGSLEARLLRRSHPLVEAFVAEAGVAVERTGALLVAWTDAQLAALPGIQAKAAQNGETNLAPVSAERVYQLEPNLGPGARGGLLVPGEAIICPFSVPLALATQAVVNGAVLLRGAPLRAARREGDLHLLDCGGTTVRCRWVVNAAGLYADEVDRCFGHDHLRVTARRGELIVFDKAARSLVTRVILPVPEAHTKGVLVSPTVYGNLLLGPTAEDRDDKTDSTTSAAGLAALTAAGRRLLPALLDEEVTAAYAGLRAVVPEGDFQIQLDRERALVCVGGIRSTGLSASMGIAEYVAELLAEAGLPLAPRADFRPVRVPWLGAAAPRPHESPDWIARDPAYGRIVCHCERVSAGEIRDAIAAPIPARSLDGLRRRTRCLMGRCQGFYCLAAVVDQLAGTLGVPAETLLGDAPP